MMGLLGVAVILGVAVGAAAIGAWLGARRQRATTRTAPPWPRPGSSAPRLHGRPVQVPARTTQPRINHYGELEE